MPKPQSLLVKKMERLRHGLENVNKGRSLSDLDQSRLVGEEEKRPGLEAEESFYRLLVDLDLEGVFPGKVGNFRVGVGIGLVIIDRGEAVADDDPVDPPPVDPVPLLEDERQFGVGARPGKDNLLQTTLPFEAVDICQDGLSHGMHGLTIREKGGQPPIIDS